jgi:hypothetical protein
MQLYCTMVLVPRRLSAFGSRLIAESRELTASP